MKKIVISAMALFMSVTFASAQGNRPEQDTQQAQPANEARPAQSVNEARPAPATNEARTDSDREYIDVFRKDLQVNDDQVGRIRTLHTETINRYNSIEPQYLKDDAAYKVRVNELLRERDERLRSILTPDQYQQYNTNRDHFRIYDSRYFMNELNQRSLNTPSEVKPVDTQYSTPKPNIQGVQPGRPAETTPADVKPADTQYSTPRPNVQPAQPAETVPVDVKPEPTSPAETRPVPPVEPISPNER